MPRRAKVLAISMMLTACVLSAWVVGRPVIGALIVGAGLVGTAYVLWRVPTRERVLADRAATVGS
jgi:uncharacterized membrane protein YbaN (DUF454 family)